MGERLLQPPPPPRLMLMPLMPMHVPLAGPTPLSEPTATAEATPATKAARTGPLLNFSFALTRRMSIVFPPLVQHPDGPNVFVR